MSKKRTKATPEKLLPTITAGAEKKLQFIDAAITSIHFGQPRSFGYKAILNISDVESQKYFSEIAGITKAASKGMSIHRDPYNGKITESFQINESYEPVIYPHEFGMLDEDIVLITPSGCCRVKKLKYLRNTAL